MPCSPLKIALIEPNTAYAAELGQLLSEILKDFSFELSVKTATADVVLVNASLAPPTPLSCPVILFGRTKQGEYTAYALRGGTAGDHSLICAMPLTNLLRCVALVQTTQRIEGGSIASSSESNPIHENPFIATTLAADAETGSGGRTGGRDCA